MFSCSLRINYTVQLPDMTLVRLLRILTRGRFHTLIILHFCSHSLNVRLLFKYMGLHVFTRHLLLKHAECVQRWYLGCTISSNEKAHI